MLLPSSVLQAWCHTPATAAHTLVLPDGCRDLILRATPGQAPQWLVTALADTTYGVASTAGERFWGYRFHPGATVDETALLKALHDCRLSEAHDALPLVDEFVRLDGCVTEALQSLSDTPSVVWAARHGAFARLLERPGPHSPCGAGAVRHCLVGGHCCRQRLRRPGAHEPRVQALV